MQKVLGIGVDVVETTRMEESIRRHGESFLQRIFCEGEIQYCQALKFPARHFAVRFAAKEAVSKAFGTGIGEKIGWLDVEVRRKASGEPFIVLHGNALKLAERLHVVQTHISLSHSDHYSVASAVIVSD